MIKYLKRGLSATMSLALVPVLGVPLPAIAQQSIEEIIVTARKREESLQEVPVAISVFTGQGLEEAGIQTARDLYANTPGLNYDTGFDQNAATPAIRGVVSNEIATYRQKVTTFLDGMPILGQQGSVPFSAIQQVEVLRGPQSAAFGRSTFGGAINYTTRDPGEDFVADLSLDVGQDGLFNAGAVVSGQLIEGTLGGLLSVESNKRDGENDWVTAEEGVSLGGEESSNVLAKLLYTPTDKLAVEFRYKDLDVDNEQTPRVFLNLDDVNRVIHPDAAATVTTCGTGVPIPSCAYVGTVNAIDEVYDYNYAATGIDEPFVRNERERYELDITYDLDNGASIQTLGFTSEEYYERATDSNLTNDAAGFERDPTNIEETYWEARYTSAGDEALRYSFGASVYDYEFLTLIYRSSANYDAGTPNQRFSETATNSGVFGNITYDLNDQMTISLEGRYQVDDVSGTAPQDDDTLYVLSQETKAFLPRLSLTYTPEDTTTYYVQVAKGNNPAGVNVGAVDPNVVAAAAAFPDQFPADAEDIAFFEEEEVLSVEVGMKGRVSNRLTYAVNAYMLGWENYTQPFNLNFEPDDFVDLDDDGVGDAGSIYEGMDFGPGRSFLGAGDVTGKGLEFEGNYFATDNLSVNFAASYIDITYDDGACSTSPLNYGVEADTTTAIGLPCVDIGGNEIGTQPKFAGSFGLNYTQPLDNGMEWFARWNTRFSSSQYVSEMNLAKLNAYSVSDLRVGLNTDIWRAELYATNIFDDDTPQGPQVFFDGRIAGPPPFAQNISYTARRGTALGLRLSYSFGG
jgi:iron complex outermembrane recepter protein